MPASRTSNGPSSSEASGKVKVCRFFLWDHRDEGPRYDKLKLEKNDAYGMYSYNIAFVSTIFITVLETYGQ